MELSEQLHDPVPIAEGKASVTYGICYMGPRNILDLRE
jgi:hypothetical protein